MTGRAGRFAPQAWLPDWMFALGFFGLPAGAARVGKARATAPNAKAAITAAVRNRFFTVYLLGVATRSDPWTTRHPSCRACSVTHLDPRSTQRTRSVWLTFCKPWRGLPD